jgi:hypothetical protein
MLLDLTWGETIGFPCPSFTSASGHCHGSTRNGPDIWSTVFAPNGDFRWVQSSPGSPRRQVTWAVRTGFPPDGYLTGPVPSDNSARWTIEDAGYLDDGHITPKGPKWYTPDVAGKDPGTLGGPFYIDFENRLYGADVYIWGYLFRKP